MKHLSSGNKRPTQSGSGWGIIILVGFVLAGVAGGDMIGLILSLAAGWVIYLALRCMTGLPMTMAALGAVLTAIWPLAALFLGGLVLLYWGVKTLISQN